MLESPPELELPCYSWPKSGWWFTIVGTLVGGIVFLAPNALNIPALSRVMLFIGLAIVPAAAIFISTFIRRTIVFLRRANTYQLALASISTLRAELDRNSQLTNMLLQERQNTRGLKIDHSYYYDSVAYIALNRKSGFSCAVGDILTVVDQTNGKHLGDFEITELRSRLYIARAVGEIDALWKGYIVQTGATHSAPPPDSLAIRFQLDNDK